MPAPPWADAQQQHGYQPESQAGPRNRSFMLFDRHEMHPSMFREGVRDVNSAGTVAGVITWRVRRSQACESGACGEVE
jgi:hypothetical protein